MEMMEMKKKKITMLVMEVISVLIGSCIFIVPYVFALNPAMLFIDTSVGEVILICITSLVGIFAVSAALEGYFLHGMKWYERVVSAVGGLLLIYPGIVTDGIGLALVAMILVAQIITRKKAVLV